MESNSNVSDMTDSNEVNDGDITNEDEQPVASPSFSMSPPQSPQQLSAPDDNLSQSPEGDLNLPPTPGGGGSGTVSPDYIPSPSYSMSPIPENYTDPDTLEDLEPSMPGGLPEDNLETDGAPNPSLGEDFQLVSCEEPADVNEITAVQEQVDDEVRVSAPLAELDDEHDALEHRGDNEITELASSDPPTDFNSGDFEVNNSTETVSGEGKETDLVPAEGADNSFDSPANTVMDRNYVTCEEVSNDVAKSIDEAVSDVFTADEVGHAETFIAGKQSADKSESGEISISDNIESGLEIQYFGDIVSDNASANNFSDNRSDNVIADNLAVNSSDNFSGAVTSGYITADSVFVNIVDTVDADNSAADEFEAFDEVDKLKETNVENITDAFAGNNVRTKVEGLHNAVTNEEWKDTEHEANHQSMALPTTNTSVDETLLSEEYPDSKGQPGTDSRSRTPSPSLPRKSRTMVSDSEEEHDEVNETQTHSGLVDNPATDAHSVTTTGLPTITFPPVAGDSYSDDSDNEFEGFDEEEVEQTAVLLDQSKSFGDSKGREHIGSVAGVGGTSLLGATTAAPLSQFKEDEVGELIADIFGDSDEEAEFEGFKDSDVSEGLFNQQQQLGSSAAAVEGGGSARVEDGGGVTTRDEEADSDLDTDVEDDDEFRRKAASDMGISDFDIMMEKKKIERSRVRRRRRNDVEIINDMDDMVSLMKADMIAAAERDRKLNEKNQTSISKLRMFPHVLAQLQKADLQLAFLDGGILHALTEWLAPLPDRSLPHLQIREGILKVLGQFPALNSEHLKDSGIGKAVMYLYKHPKETRQNRIRAGKLIHEWARPIFNLTSNYKALSREERQQRDYEQIPKRRRISSDGGGGAAQKRSIDGALAGGEKALKPGDPGWICRARVPMPSNRDYVIRPESRIKDDFYDGDEEGGTGEGGGPAAAQVRSRGLVRKTISRYEKHQRAFSDRKRRTAKTRAVEMSIAGTKMSI